MQGSYHPKTARMGDSHHRKKSTQLTNHHPQLAAKQAPGGPDAGGLNAPRAKGRAGPGRHKNHQSKASIHIPLQQLEMMKNQQMMMQDEGSFGAGGIGDYSRLTNTPNQNKYTFGEEEDSPNMHEFK